MNNTQIRDWNDLVVDSDILAQYVAASLTLAPPDVRKAHLAMLKEALSSNGYDALVATGRELRNLRPNCNSPIDGVHAFAGAKPEPSP